MKKFVPVLIAGALLSTTAAFALFGTIRFGYDGRSGYGGAAGVSGGSGQSIVVRADGAAKSFDLSGVDGISGAPGSDGESARGCGAYYDTDNLIGADGGHGGSGGSGGTGGTGGNLTVYANTINDLSQILVRSSGGRPGFGAPVVAAAWVVSARIQFGKKRFARSQHRQQLNLSVLITPLLVRAVAMGNMDETARTVHQDLKVV